MTKRFSVSLPGRAPGDELVLTAAIRDWKLQYGDEVEIEVKGRFRDIWRNNPYLTDLTGRPGVRAVRPNELEEIRRMRADGVRTHYVTAYHAQIAKITGMKFPCRFSKPDLHLTPTEREYRPVQGRYWVVVPGGKTDMTVKMWEHARWQRLIDMLKPWGLAFVQEGATKKMCVHPPMDGVLNLVGKTSIRQMILNILHSEGVVCGISLPMHIAGALGKPCVVVAGGREEPWWEAYVNDYGAFGTTADPVVVPHRFLHTMGMLSCCPGTGTSPACWKRRVVRIEDKMEGFNKSLCVMPVKAGPQDIPKCMELITPDHAAEAVMWYYETGILPPLGVRQPHQPEGDGTHRS